MSAAYSEKLNIFFSLIDTISVIVGARYKSLRKLILRQRCLENMKFKYLNKLLIDLYIYKRNASYLVRSPRSRKFMEMIFIFWKFFYKYFIFGNGI